MQRDGEAFTNLNPIKNSYRHHRCSRLLYFSISIAQLSKPANKETIDFSGRVSSLTTAATSSLMLPLLPDRLSCASQSCGFLETHSFRLRLTGLNNSTQLHQGRRALFFSARLDASAMFKSARFALSEHCTSAKLVLDTQTGVSLDTGKQTNLANNLICFQGLQGCCSLVGRHRYSSIASN